jgi:hypothetical protein
VSAVSRVFHRAARLSLDEAGAVPRAYRCNCRFTVRYREEGLGQMQLGCMGQSWSPIRELQVDHLSCAVL